ncbi:HAD-IIB family hydrolase [Nitratireductor kimnyeongensis]|uniref:HAD-IIB family hydrolase n=1 Tax=Nitratireductor kimnyeongensis TaxID=430679 RepID=A0ABW0T7E7_9HYPH|nr:HAD-IIB family hydrolase [Nitratireductor kimnyeongensis]QZZ36417.1 HAD-IIB family hydrolase [Nitratireductor kimnyeongensis]
MIIRPRLVVFSDLDGTLLDHETYDFTPALPAIKALRARFGALILASSKTAAEIAPLRRALDFAHCPAIVENGAGILASERGSQHDSRSRYEELIGHLDALPDELRRSYAGFSDWDAREVAARTGLSLEAAQLAKQREYSEPGIWSGTEEGFTAFCNALNRLGVHVQKGGRFATLSFGGTKGQRVRELLARLEDKRVPVVSVALGDAPNDRDMLESVDIAVEIPNPAHPGIGKIARGGSQVLRKARLAGPAGWNEEMLAVLEEIE